ncbi:MAG: c-type cytochrome [Kofleriaceae bacterium]
MLSKSAARAFFLAGTALCTLAFVGLTIDTFSRIPKQTRQDQLTDAVVRGKDLWDRSNCMGCHTLLGEGAYYAPELTKVIERRGPVFIRAMLTNPEAMYPGQRRMWKYDFSERDKDDLIAFFTWIGGMDLNGFPPAPTLGAVATPQGTVAVPRDRPQIFSQLCVACHMLGGAGAKVGPALDGVGARLTQAQLRTWLQDPPSIKPGTAMPKLPLSEGQLDELAAFLSTLK